MSFLTILGGDPSAYILRLACKKNGLDSVTQITEDYSPVIPAAVLPANISKVITAMIPEQELKEISSSPNRKHIRLAKSGYLISEIPLGKFYSDRYGASLYNLKESDLIDLLSSRFPSSPPESSSQYTSQSDVLAVTSNPGDSYDQVDSIFTYYAEIPRDKNSGLINTTWIGDKQLAHQFSTIHSSHVVFLSHFQDALDPKDWHSTIREAADSATLVEEALRKPMTRDRMPEGRSIAELGAAWYSSNWLLPESVHIGIEDAWVLSRMFENYEEDIANALFHYKKYRKVRLDRLRRKADQEFTRLFETKAIKKLGQHIGLAFSTRFVPEIYMNSQDWLHGYDCLRGFR